MPPSVLNGPASPPRQLLIFPVTNLHYYVGSDSCRYSPAPTGLPAYCASPSCRSTPNHVMPPVDRFSRQVPASTVSFRLRHLPAGSPRHPAETGSSSCRPTIRLRLLPTPPRDDAVTLGYGASAYSDTDLHRADETPSRAHWERLPAATRLARRASRLEAAPTA
jgi:hypothetical protein